jgi:hypothetical protein
MEKFIASHFLVWTKSWAQISGWQTGSLTRSARTSRTVRLKVFKEVRMLVHLLTRSGFPQKPQDLIRNVLREHNLLTFLTAALVTGCCWRCWRCAQRDKLIGLYAGDSRKKHKPIGLYAEDARKETNL